jgi:hypothetical protein
MLAFQMQAAAEGSLNYETRRKLNGATLPGPGDQLRDGTRITKVWRGERYEVIREGAGFSWDGRPFPSLTAVATEITGVKRNGPKFFGLRDGDGE